MQDQLKQNEGELNESIKELNENKTIENLNNELDETANKIINSIPNTNQENNLNNNNSRISNNNSNIPNENKNNENLTNNSNLVKQPSNLNNISNNNSQNKSAETVLIIKDKIFSNDELDENNLHNNLENNNTNNNSRLNNENLENANNENSFKNIINENPLNEKETLSVFEKFKYDFSGSDYFFVDMNEMLEFKKHNFSISDFYNLLKKISEDYKQITIIINFPNIINNIGFLDLESINTLNEIIALTDIYIFDKKDALALFNLMAQINSEEDNYEDKKNLEHLFIKEIKKTRKSHPKIGIFLDELKRVTIIEQQSSSNLILFHTDYEFSLIPANVSKVISEDYKKLFVVHYENLKSVFVGGLFSRMLYRKPFNSGFTAGNESLKRVIELLRFNLDAPLDPNFFMIRIKKTSSMPCEEEKLKKKKEQHFVLDCSNVINSKMQEYNPLYDGNLISYFSSKYIRGHLKKLGFINKKGSILQDPDNKRLGIIESKKLNKIYEEEKVNLLKIKDKREKLKLQIKNLLQGNTVMKSGNMKEIEKLAKVYNFYPQSEKKLPSVNDFKKSINKNIKINSEIYIREIQKGKRSRSKSQHKSPKRSGNNNYHGSSTRNKLAGNTLLDVIEKIEDKILYNDLSEISGNNQNNNNNNISNIKNNYANNNSNIINESNLKSNNNNNINQSNLSKTKTKSGKSQISQKSKLENSNLKNSSINKNVLDPAIEEDMEGKSAENNSINNNNLVDSKILNEAGENDSLGKNLENENNDFDIKKEIDIGEEENKSVNNVNLNLDNSKIEKSNVLNNNNINKTNENNAADNSLLEKSVNNLSKISKKNDISGNDLNVSGKKSNIVSENNVVSINNVFNENEGVDNIKKEVEESVNNNEEGKLQEN